MNTKRCIALFTLLLLGMFVGQISAETWRVPRDFPTIQEAIDSPDVLDGDTILISKGSYFGALVTKAVEIKGIGNAKIVDGPTHPSYSWMQYGFRLNEGSGGATISHLTFENVELAVMNGASVSDVTVTQCTFVNSVQAVSNWGGSGWLITQNVIRDLQCRNGGGIGILIADWRGTTVEDNVVSHNRISGTLHVDPSDLGGYQGTGVVLYADFRWGRDGSNLIAWNRIVKNNIALQSDTPEVVDVVAIELSQVWNSPPPPDPEPIVVRDNAVGFNDLRGTTLQLVLTPEWLEDFNSISRNLGDNRGHGMHPAAFGPGGN